MESWTISNNIETIYETILQRLQIAKYKGEIAKQKKIFATSNNWQYPK